MSLTTAVEELIDDTGTRPVLRVRADDQLSSREMGEVLRAAELARKWLETVERQPREKLTPFRCFVLGYLASCKDRT